MFWAFLVLAILLFGCTRQSTQTLPSFTPSPLPTLTPSTPSPTPNSLKKQPQSASPIRKVIKISPNTKESWASSAAIIQVQGDASIDLSVGASANSGGKHQSNQRTVMIND